LFCKSLPVFCLLLRPLFFNSLPAHEEEDMPRRCSSFYKMVIAAVNRRKVVGRQKIEDGIGRGNHSFRSRVSIFIIIFYMIRFKAYLISWNTIHFSALSLNTQIHTKIIITSKNKTLIFSFHLTSSFSYMVGRRAILVYFAY
jgi:hypothetical protein